MLEQFINDQWRYLRDFSADEGEWIEVRKVVFEILAHLDAGILRSAEKINGAWIVHAWIKKAILMSFKLMPNKMVGGEYYDKIPLKFSNWSHHQFKESKIRAVPGSIVRHGAFIGQNTVLMPSFVNIGAYVDDNTMVDTWATIGSCAQIGKHCHISGGAGIGGVLEPLNASPVIIEDHCFIGARSEIVEGVVVETGAVISMGVYLSPSTKILNRETGEITYGRVPAYSVVVPGTAPSKNGTHLYAAVIIKTVDETTRKKTTLNDLLRS